jgi:methylated-DNA-[protein]-cysteine S-methyltransferase
MNTSIRLHIDHLDTPIGRLVFVVDGEARLCAVGFVDGEKRMDRQVRAYADDPAFELVPESNPGGTTAMFRAYFDGELTAIDRMSVAVGGTPFQKRVWNALREIPCGETWSYGQLARHIGKPRAVRAVGLANGANPVGIVVPCHRVIGADGSMTGYGGGIERKKWLLAHERRAGGSLELFA